MEVAWHFVHQGQPQGPVAGRGLLELVLQAVLSEDTLVWAPGIGGEWVKLKDSQLAEFLPPAAKRQRLGAASGKSPDAALLREVPGWVEALDEPSSIALFEKALFTKLEEVIPGRPALRDALLTAYVQRHPASEDRDPSAYAFSDDFLLDAVEDFDSREEMWRVLGQDNAAAVGALIAAAATLDRQYCAQLQGLALLSRARSLLRQAGGNDAGSDGAAADVGAGAGAGKDPGQQLLALLQSEPALVVARDMDGRSLWHDLVAGEQEALLRLLLPAAASSAGSGSGAGQQPAAAGAAAAAAVATTMRATRAEQPNPLNLPDLSGCTPLHLAAESSQLEVARVLMDAGANLDMQNRDPSKYASGDWSVKSKGLDFAIPVPTLHQTPLHVAAEAGDLDMMRLLVERGAMLNLRDTAGCTPLHLALEAQDERAVALLLQAGADPTLASNDMGEDSTPLHAAAAAGRAGILRALLDAWPPGRLPTAVNQAGEGWTPLMLAARRGSLECVQLLLEQGADPAARNQQGRTAAEIAEVNKRQAVAAALLEWEGQREQQGGAHQLRGQP